MIRLLSTVLVLVSITGCSLLPKPHDAVMFDHLVTVDIKIEQVNCESPDWKPAIYSSQHLAKYATWRSDPQADNLTGLHKHLERMNQGGTKTFCELGKRTASSRVQAAKTAWEGR